ncbi:MAG: PQQ-binding-like beta-propeller repeat protein [Ignavibacteria bacterium]|nr:PQQ-binding-like beta-propeller repeat protein [Ignavibacteria bacterium]
MKYSLHLFIIIVIISVLSVISINPHNAYSQSRGLEFGDIVWQILIPDNPGTTFNDKQIRSIKQIPDVNGDNVNDVAVATGNYWTICFSGINGAIIWQYSTHFGSINTGSVEWEEAMEIADVNNDGTYDVVIGCGGGNEMVYALNGINGNVLWSYGSSTTTSDGDIESIKIKYDYNGDGFNDALVSASGVTNGGRHALICLNAINGEVIFYRTQPQPFTDDVVATKSGGAIGVNNNGAPYSVTGFDTLGNSVWSYNSPGNTWSLIEVPDIGGDSAEDIIGLGGFTGSVFAISGNTGTLIWTQNLGSSNNGKITLLNDADGNGFADITLSAPQSANRVDTKTGNIIWTNFLSSSYLRGIDNIGDITGDSIDDIVIATQLQPRLLVLDGMNGNILFNHIFGSTLSQRGDRAAVLNDIDSNGINEFLGGNREGRVICFYGGNGTITSVNNNNNLFPAGYKLYQNYPNPFNPGTGIKFDIAKSVNVKLAVYDILGKEISTLINEKLNAGSYQVSFDGSSLPSGIYFYQLKSGDYSETMKMNLIK